MSQTPPAIEQRHDRLAAALAALLYVWLALPLLDAAQLSPQWDEFIRLTNAKRLWLGEVPYRDYFDHTPLVPDLLYALVFTFVGGANAAAARLVTLVVVSAAAALTFLALRRRNVARVPAAVASAWFPIVGFMVWPIPHHHWLAAAFGLVAVACARRPLLAGLVLGVCFLTSQTQAVVVAAAGMAVLLSDADARSAARRVALGVAAIATVFVVAAVASGALGGFIDFALVFPFTGYKGAGGVNTVSLWSDLVQRSQLVLNADHAAPLRILAMTLLVATASGLLFVGGALTAVVAGSWRSNRTQALAAGGLLIASALAFLPRTDVFHAAMFAVLPLAVAPLLLRDHPRLARALTAVTAASVLVGTIALLTNRVLAEAPPSVRGPPAPDLAADPALAGLGEADALMVLSDRRLMVLRGYAQQHPEATLFASPVGAAAYFFGPRPAVPYTLVYDPSVRYLRDTDYVRIADALERRHPELVMLTTPEAEAAFLDPPRWRGAGAERIARLLRDNYRPWRRDAGTVFLKHVKAP